MAQPTPIAAMLLAAGRGERMRPLTDHTPKPLLVVHGKPLMQWPLEALARSGSCSHVVINTAWLGTQINQRWGDAFAPTNSGRTLPLRYSHEGQDFGVALETAGGIARALPDLGEVFWVLAGDVYAPDFVFDLADIARFARSDALAHLWLVPNPEHHPNGDFGLSTAPLSDDSTGPAWHHALNLPAGSTQPRYTYSTIGLYRRALFTPPWSELAVGNATGVAAPLAPLLRRAMDAGRISAALYHGRWTDVGTPQRLAALHS